LEVPKGRLATSRRPHPRAGDARHPCKGRRLVGIEISRRYRDIEEISRYRGDVEISRRYRDIEEISRHRGDIEISRRYRDIEEISRHRGDIEISRRYRDIEEISRYRGDIEISRRYRDIEEISRHRGDIEISRRYRKDIQEISRRRPWQGYSHVTYLHAEERVCTAALRRQLDSD
jgi:hypothetical protein